ELLLELFSEEIPARMQAKAEGDLLSAVLKGLAEAGLEPSASRSMSGPRRLTVVLDGLATRSADVEEERKGPKVGAPEQAVAGFLRGAGLESIDQAEVRSDPKKGDFYVAVRKIEGRNTSDIVAELVPQIVRNFHWPKSMRTGPNAVSNAELRWVRPLQRILCVFDGAIVPFEVDGLSSGNETEGHRVHGRGPFAVNSAAEYEAVLSGEGHVMLTREARRDKIETDAKAVCEASGLELFEDRGLLEEVVGLAEWPVAILGEMDESFLSLPPEVIQLSMRTHQKYFAVRDPKTGALAPNFVVVANVAATDGGVAIAKGNRKVLSARLDDGRFFWENDKRTGLEAMAPKLSTIKFKDELGSIGDKVERVAVLARELAPKVGADADLAERAARLCKADLVSEMVYEFPELQGVMGRYYALEAGEPASVADAIRDHYKPQGPSDAVPSDPVAIAVALADKLDTLVGFWAIDEKPTGSKDPFALRRAALGVVRIVLENGVRLGLKSALSETLLGFVAVRGTLFHTVMVDEGGTEFSTGIGDVEGLLEENVKTIYLANEPNKLDEDVVPAIIIADLLSFFADRLKQYLRDQGQRHDLIDAVFALGSSQRDAEGERLTAGQAAPAQAPRAVSAGNDDLGLIVKRVEALAAFLDTEDGANLLAGYQRAANILNAEEKKDNRAFDGEVDGARLTETGEIALHTAIVQSIAAAKTALDAEDFEAAMSALAGLRGPVDAFFDGPDSVMVNADDPVIRENRLNLLNMMRGAVNTVADFGKISG
ncbi:MAG: glycine--tRNA ligase subunit beta, partial [Pseudomonadota bacterium]